MWNKAVSFALGWFSLFPNSGHGLSGDKLSKEKAKNTSVSMLRRTGTNE